MRYTIELYTLTTVKDAYGAPTETWTKTLTMRAGMKPTGGSKVIENNEKFNSRLRQWSVYYRSSIVEKMRVKFAGEWYRILSIDPVGFKEGLIINTELIND